MSHFKIEFSTDSDAFQAQDVGIEHEVSEIFKVISEQLSYGDQQGKIRDINGNTIGDWEWSG